MHRSFVRNFLKNRIPLRDPRRLNISKPKHIQLVFEPQYLLFTKRTRLFSLATQLAVQKAAQLALHSATNRLFSQLCKKHFI